MGDPMLAEKVRYHTILRNRLARGGRSAAQVAAHERILTLAAEASDVMDLQRKIEAENLDFAVSRANSVDTWNAKAAAARDTENPQMAAAYERVAETAAAANDFTALSQAIMAAEEQAKQIGTQQSGLRYIFIGILYGALEYLLRAPGNAYEKSKLAEELRDRLRQLSDLGADFDDLCRQPFCRRHAPFTDEQWRRLRETVAAMAADRPDAAAVDTARRAGRELLAAVQSDWDKLAALQREEDERTSRRTSLASRLSDEAGPYEFATLWERKW